MTIEITEYRIDAIEKIFAGRKSSLCESRGWRNWLNWLTVWRISLETKNGIRLIMVKGLV
jgi:hypothetical protein